ncbi:hypothetical protein A7K94_0221230, partial [Modestobacter sp. VKM Ac-2676]
VARGCPPPRPDDGMSALIAVLSTPEARACLQALGRYADDLVDPPGAEPRTRAQKMADCLVDLILRPGGRQLVEVQVQLTLVAAVETLAGGDQPGELDGQTVPAEMVRHLARRLGLVPDEPLPAPPPPTSSPDEGVPATRRPRNPGTWSGWVPRRRRTTCSGRSGNGTRRGRCGWPPRGRPSHHCHRTRRRPTLHRPQNRRGRWMAAADAGVDEASMAVVAAHRAVAAAGRAVDAAEWRASADERAWARSPVGAITRARDSLAALAAATPAQQQAIAELLDR